MKKPDAHEVMCWLARVTQWMGLYRISQWCIGHAIDLAFEKCVRYRDGLRYKIWILEAVIKNLEKSESMLMQELRRNS